MRKLYLPLVALICILGIVLSCVQTQEEYVVGETESSLGLTVQEARSFFESAFILESRSGNQAASTTKHKLFPADFTPRWDQAVTSNDGLVAWVEVPLITRTTVKAYRSEITKGTPRVSVVPVEQRLAVGKRLKDGRLIQSLLTIVPDAHYRVHSKTAILGNKHGNFNGIILCGSVKSHTMMQAALFSDGQSVKALSLHGNNLSSEQKKALLKTILNGVQFICSYKTMSRSGGKTRR